MRDPARHARIHRYGVGLDTRTSRPTGGACSPPASARTSWASSRGVSTGDGRLVIAAPAYVKNDGMGDFSRDWGFADALRRASGGGMSIEDLRITPAREVAHRSIGRAAAEPAWSDGRSMQLEEAITAARALRLVSHG